MSGDRLFALSLGSRSRSWTLLLATKRILLACYRYSRRRRTPHLARLIQVAKGTSRDFRNAEHCHLQRTDLRHRKSLPMISIDGTTPRISDLTRPIYSSSSIRSPMAEQGRRRIQPFSRKMIMVLQERACGSHRMIHQQHDPVTNMIPPSNREVRCLVFWEGQGPN
jgi:hypothetical protein